MAADEWTTSTIQSLIDSGAIVAHKDGNYGSSYPRVTDFVEEGVPFLTAKLLDDAGNIDFDAAPRLAYDKADKLTYGFIETDDVLLSHNATIGRVAVVPTLTERTLVGTSLTYYRLNQDRLLPRYLAAFFSGRDFQNQLKAVMTHSTRNQVPITAQRKLNVVVPPLHDQAAISEFLGCLDQKIQLNRRVNCVLESMARAVFKAWFIDFEPVKAKAAGAESFPGMPQEIFDDLSDTLVDSEIGKSPKGWDVGELGAVMQHPRRTAKPFELDSSTPYVGLEHIPRQSISLSDWGKVGTVTSNKHRFRRGEFLFGKLRPYFHKVAVAPVDGVCSTDVVVVAPNEEGWSGFVLFHLSSSAFVAYTNAASTGTKMPRTNWKDMRSYPVILPPRLAAESFSQAISPWLHMIISNVHESRVINAIRDTVLPRVISGNLAVPTTNGVTDGR